MKDDHLFRGRLVRLAAPQAGDYEIMAAWFDDPEFQRLSTNAPARPYSAEELKADDEKWRAKDENSRVGFRIRTLADDRLIGFVDLNGIQWNNGVAGLGISIADRGYWGKGYGSDALELILRYAFDELNLYRVGLDSFAYNERAIHVYEKMGFVHEGRARGALIKDGKRYDDIFMGILREEWEARQGR